MAKLMESIGLLVALACVAVGVSGESEKIRSAEEFMQKINALGEAEPDQVQALLEQVDLDADVEIYYTDADFLLELATINRDNCEFNNLSYRFQMCKNLDLADEDPHSNMHRYCLDRAQKQFDLCHSLLGELFSQALKDLEEGDKKLVLDFEQKIDQGNRSMECDARVEAAHQELLETRDESQVVQSCKHVLRNLELIEMLANEQDKVENKELEKWLKLGDMCFIYLERFSPDAIEWQRYQAEQDELLDAELGA